MTRLFLTLTILTGVLAAMTSCKGHHSSDTVVVAPSDSAAYKRGAEDARQLLLHADDIHQLHDGLLEIRSRETYLRGHIRPASADAYIKGFHDHVTANNDSLAKILF